MKKTFLITMILILMLNACGSNNNTNTTNKENISPERPSENTNLNTPL